MTSGGTQMRFAIGKPHSFHGVNNLVSGGTFRPPLLYFCAARQAQYSFSHYTRKYHSMQMRRPRFLRAPLYCVPVYAPVKSSWIAAAAFLPAPMARMTVAAPVTASPPA